MNMKWLIVMGLMLTGINALASSRAQFIPTGPKVQRESKDYDAVEVYHDKNDIDYPYKEIGRIYLEGDLSAPKQIYEIRFRAGYFGADAVILISSREDKADGAAVNNVASYSSESALRYTGIAIIKRTGETK